MIRNAVDHGLENREERLAAGKPEVGVVDTKASHDAGDIVIEIADSGKGLDKQRIARQRPAAWVLWRPITRPMKQTFSG
jgi:chemotaxis protein histidine kinase CheA